MIYVDRMYVTPEGDDAHDADVQQRFGCPVETLSILGYRDQFATLERLDLKRRQMFDKPMVTRLLKAHKFFGLDRDFRPLPARLTLDALDPARRPYREEVALIYGGCDVQGHYESRHVWGWPNVDIDCCARLTAALEFYWMLAWPTKRDALSRSWRAFHNFNCFGMYDSAAMAAVQQHQLSGETWVPCDFDRRVDDLGYTTRFVSWNGLLWLLPRYKNAPILRFQTPAWASALNPQNLTPKELNNEQPAANDTDRYASDGRREHAA